MLLAVVVVTEENPRAFSDPRPDVILYKGEWWIVPEWILEPQTGARRPARLIRLAGLDHQRFDPPQHGFDIVVRTNIPKEIYYGQSQPPTGSFFVVIENPNIELPGVRP